MLVSNVSGEMSAGILVKDSKFYIEIAKFVQAYRTIVRNPNDFLTEVGEASIDEENDRLSWAQFVKIVQSCDLGFEVVPSPTDLVVYYNYALQIGSLDGLEKRIASVQDVANAQKHYYNFVDESASKAEQEYEKYHEKFISRDKEASAVDTKLMLLKTGKILAFFMMMLGALSFAFGAISFFVRNNVVQTIGSLIPVWDSQYVGAIIFAALGLVLFAVFDSLFVLARHRFIKLKQASETLFSTADDSYRVDVELKLKLDQLKKDLSIVQAELADKSKKYDVMHVIEVLRQTNKYYIKFSQNEEEQSLEVEVKQQEESITYGDRDEEVLAPVKLTKEQSENVRMVRKKAIGLEGKLDEEAYNEKFEQSSKRGKSEKQEKTTQQRKDEDIKAKKAVEEEVKARKQAQNEDEFERLRQSLKMTEEEKENQKI